ncbi:hypothetical protein JM84_1997 [Dokdonia sp. Hel_I_63]|jgi:hypothetical protein|nr:hypothetical protein Krodi_2688 [Dokdonia sp. 4H-3-7-5]TVZ23080.1 hypothetical protein JM84_1997 [Dokdonia sp. Hel_I_63]
MAKTYTTPSSGHNKTNQFEPKQETVDFLLNFSKALSVMHYKSMKFEAFIN